MMIYDNNPFQHQDKTVADQDRYDIWEMLVRRDIDGFLAQDWDAVKDDFIAPGFFGIDANFVPNPDNWKLTFPSLDAYKTSWLVQAAETANITFSDDLRQGLFMATDMQSIDIVDQRALVHKKFDGKIKKTDGTHLELLWQTLYVCDKVHDSWKISSFVGYMPNPLGNELLGV